MKQYAVVFLSTVVVVGVAVWVTQLGTTPPLGGVACTTEAKLCPDGSAVGRTGPNCEFAACPAVSTTTPPGGGGSILPYTSGIQGSISLGPTCPVVRDPPDPQCADKPYVTTVSVYRAGSATPFAIGSSDAQGAFRLSLPPGPYTITAGGSAVLPRCSRVDVTVGPTGYSTADISCDTGIR